MFTRIFLLIAMVGLVMAYPRIDACVRSGHCLERGETFMSDIGTWLESTSAGISIQKSYNHAKVLITGSSVAAEAEAHSSAKAH